MKRYQLSPQARLDLLNLWNYLSENASFETADKVMTELKAGMRKLASTPGLGHRREDVTDLPILFYRVHRYLIAYDPRIKPLGIVRVVHGARDLEEIFGYEH